jgi:hypothetical protein
MTAIQQAPWSLRSYAALIFAAAILTALATGRIESWTRVLWVAAFGIAICGGSRIIWWLLVVGNALYLFVGPILLGDTWLSIPFGLIGLALLLAPESRRYVFERDPKPGRASELKDRTQSEE